MKNKSNQVNMHLITATMMAVGLVAILLLSFSLDAAAGTLAPPQVVAKYPEANTHTAEGTTPISITYDQEMNPITVNPKTFVVHARQTGWLKEMPEVEGGMIMLQPEEPLRAGELVQVSATTQTLSMEGEGPLNPTVWEFTTAPWGGNAYFHEHQVLQSGDSRDAVLGDLDGDGDLDAFTTSCFSNLHSVYHNDGSGWFTLVQNFSFSTCFTDAELGDLDGDGDLDALLIDYWSNGNKVFWNNGDGTFVDSGQNIFSYEDSYAELGDLDGDGDLDFLVTSAGYDPGLLRVWKNNGNGFFSFFNDFDTAYKHMGVALGDLDDDGDLDAFTSGWDNTFNKVWLNDGTGIFTEQQSIPNANTVFVQLGDLDGDGDLDAYLANMTIYDNTDLPDEVWLNDGTGHFTDSGQRLETVFSPMPALGDLDADGDLDVYLSGDPFTSAPDEVWTNDGTGTFTLFRTVDENYPGGITALGDLDGDGNLDAFNSSQDPAYSYQVYLNGDWTQAEDIPHPLALSAHVQCPNDPNSFYVIGGADGPGSPTNYVFRYDGEEDSWHQLASLPGAGYGLTGVCLEGKIYVQDLSPNLLIYDIATNTWIFEAGVPRITEGAALGAWDGKLFLAGGSIIGTDYEATDQVDIYDIASHTWMPASGKPMPQASDYAGVVQIGSYLYILGGMDLIYEEVYLIQRYNLATDTWQTAPYPSGMVFPALAATGEHLFALGGDPPGDEVWTGTDLVEVLELREWGMGEWQALGDPLPKLSLGPSSFCSEEMLGGEIWSVSGGYFDDEGNGNMSDASLYYPAEPCISFGVDLPEPWQGEGPAGGSVNYTMSITNTGVVTDIFTLDIETSWGPGMPLGGPITIGPGESTLVVIGVDIPIEAMWGDLGITDITATSMSNPAATDTTTITTRVLGYQVEVNPLSPDSLAGYPGEVLTYTLLVSNIGDYTDSYTVTISATWGTATPISVGPILPGKATEMVVTVEIPQEALHGDWDVATITLTSQADPRISKSIELTSSVPWHRVLIPLSLKN